MLSCKVCVDLPRKNLGAPGIVTESRPLLEKAEMPMLVTLLGMLTEVRLVHDRNALNVDNQ